MNVSGIDFDLSNVEELNVAELDFLVRCATPGAGESRVTVGLEERRHGWARDARYAAIDGSRLEFDGERIQVGNRVFSAEIDLSTLDVSLFRDDEGDTSLRLTMRAAVTALLPSLGWIPLHASAVDTGGSALVFCGRSGAGKSTLAATSPFPLLSDEMVSVSADPPRARGTSFWGDSVCKAPLSETSVPLRAIVLLEKSREFRLARVTPAEAMRALVGKTLVPVGGALWPTVLPMLASLAGRVEVWRMAWWIDSPPWDRLAEAGLCGIAGRAAEGDDCGADRPSVCAVVKQFEDADSSEYSGVSPHPMTAEFVEVDL